MKTDRIHFGYIITFLIIVIIGLITIKWGSIKELTNYITFALTLTSLVLALLAIVYSFFSNSSMTRNISNLEDASKKISINSDLLNSATEKLEKNLGDIPTSLKNIESKADNTLKAFEEFSKKELISRKLTNSSEVNSTDNGIALGKKLAYKGSISSMGMLLALKLAFEKNIAFNLEELSIEAEISDESYLHGFLVACGAIDLVKYDSIKLPGDKWNWKIVELDQDIIDNIEGAIDEIIKENAGEEYMSFIAEGFEKIRNYFNEE